MIPELTVNCFRINYKLIDHMSIASHRLCLIQSLNRCEMHGTHRKEKSLSKQGERGEARSW